MTFGEAVKLVLSQFGIGVLWIQLGIWLGLVLVVLMGFGSIFLSAWGLEWITATFLVFYLIIVLGVIYSPITWSGISGTAILAGQPGGEPNLNLNDGITVLKRWAPIALDKMSLVLIFWVPAWFLYTILFSTEGYVKQNVFLFVLIPMLVYFAKDEWPTGKLVLRIAGYLMVAIAVYIVGTTVFGTVERKVADPSSVVLLDYQQEQERQTIEREKRVAKDLTALKKSGKAFTAEQQAVWEYLEQKRQAQSLRLKDMKSNVEEFVTEAKPTQSAWWKQYWPLVGGIIIGGIALAVYSRRRLAGGSGAAGTAHAAPAGAHAPTKGKTGWGTRVFQILFLMIVGYVGFLYYTGKIGYDKIHTVVIGNLAEQQVCGLPENAWLTFRPVNPVLIAFPRGNAEEVYDITRTMRMVTNLEESPKRFSFPSEEFRTNQYGCTALSPSEAENWKQVGQAKSAKSVLLRIKSAWRLTYE